MKHEIKNRWTGEVLFTYEAPEGMESGMIARHAVETAIAQGADLRGANLVGANLVGAKNAPMIIAGLLWTVYIDGTGMMRIGCQDHSVEDWENFTDEKISAMDSKALTFWNQYKSMLLSACDTHKHVEEQA